MIRWGISDDIEESMLSPTLTGRVYTWGESSYGQLGTGAAIVKENCSPSPTMVFLKDGKKVRCTQVDL